MLVGYTHANWIYTDEIIDNVDSWDFASSYPYILLTHQFPATEFKKCNIKNVDNMSKRFAYLLVVKFYDIQCKYFNNFISQSKARNIKGGRYDNGRIIQAKELEIVLTDVDFYFILSAYDCDYEIVECYYAKYDYLPKQFIKFVLDKYENKTKLKNVEGKEIEYSKEKNKYNALYGMSVTNMIRDEVIFDNETGWDERELTNDEIIEMLKKEKKKSFLSFAYGVWVTAFARSNLLKNVVKLDEYVIYCDTDSIKLKEGYDIQVIEEYNNFVKRKIKRVSELFNFDINKFSPKDNKGVEQTIGIFDKDAHYEQFITQGAKKYAFTKIKKNDKIKETDNIIKKIDENNYLVLGITVAGVPKQGSKALKSLEDFKDDFIFTHEFTNKNLLIYCDNQLPRKIVDYQGNEYTVTDKSGCCIVPTTYVLGKSLEYATLISDNSSKRAIYKEV